MAVMLLASCTQSEQKTEEIQVTKTPPIFEEKLPEEPIAEEVLPLIIEGFEALALTYDNERNTYAYRGEEGLFIDPADLLELCGLDEYTINYDGEELRISAPKNLNLSAAKGDCYISVNGRYLYAETEYITSGDKVLLPQEPVERIFNVKFSDEPDGSLSADTENIKLIKGGEDYYDVTFSGDDIYWLSHIIQAEADTQPLAGMIGVGNVVLNRTKTEGFPDTVFNVIFEFQNTAQFTPKTSTALSRLVSEDVLIATYLVLEGYNTVGESLFFQNPVAAETNWIAMAREFAVTIGDVDFYY